MGNFRGATVTVLVVSKTITPLRGGVITTLGACGLGAGYLAGHAAALGPAFVLRILVCAALTGVLFAGYVGLTRGLLRLHARSVGERRARRSVRVAIDDASSTSLPDPLADEEAELEARFAAIEARERR